MNKETDKLNLTSIGCYGAALAGLSLCGHATAGVLSLEPTPDTVEFGSLGAQGIVLGQIDSVSISVGQYNDFYGKTIFAGYGIAGFAEVNRSQTLTPQFFNSNTGFSFSTMKTGTEFFGFLTDSGKLGWFQVDFGGFEGDVVYLAAAFSDAPGESIQVGTVPLPASSGLMALGLLAAGASGVRKLRERTRLQIGNAGD
ncbi:hypothetical protein [Methylomonas sp. MgM2]